MTSRRKRALAGLLASAALLLAACSSDEPAPAQNEDVPEQSEPAGPGGIIEDTQDTVDDLNQREEQLEQQQSDLYGE